MHPQHGRLQYSTAHVADTLEQHTAAGAVSAHDTAQFSDPVPINQPHNVFAHAAYQRNVHVTPDVLISAGDGDDAATYRDGVQNATSFSTMMDALGGWQQSAAQVAIQVLIIGTALLLLLYIVRTVARYWRRRRRQAAAAAAATLAPSTVALRHRIKSH